MKVIRVLILLLFLSGLLWVFYCFITLPDLSGLGNKTRVPSISVLDDNKIIMGSSGDVYAGSVNYNDISENYCQIRPRTFLHSQKHAAN